MAFSRLASATRYGPVPGHDGGMVVTVADRQSLPRVARMWHGWHLVRRYPARESDPAGVAVATALWPPQATGLGRCGTLVYMAEEHAGYQLAHPVYLDVAMMISFLAYLEGGVVTQEEATQKESGARERLLKGRAGLRARFPWAFDAEAGTEGSTQRRDEISLESKSARQHTVASLFNLLYGYLREDDQLVDLKEPAQLEELQTGQLIELTGEYLGNPLEDILAFVAA